MGYVVDSEGRVIEEKKVKVGGPRDKGSSSSYSSTIMAKLFSTIKRNYSRLLFVASSNSSTFSFIAIFTGIMHDKAY